MEQLARWGCCSVYSLPLTARVTVIITSVLTFFLLENDTRTDTRTTFRNLSFCLKLPSSRMLSLMRQNEKSSNYLSEHSSYLPGMYNEKDDMMGYNMGYMDQSTDSKRGRKMRRRESTGSYQSNSFSLSSQGNDLPYIDPLCASEHSSKQMVPKSRRMRRRESTGAMSSSSTDSHRQRSFSKMFGLMTSGGEPPSRSSSVRRKRRSSINNSKSVEEALAAEADDGYGAASNIVVSATIFGPTGIEGKMARRKSTSKSGSSDKGKMARRRSTSRAPSSEDEPENMRAEPSEREGRIPRRMSASRSKSAEEPMRMEGKMARRNSASRSKNYARQLSTGSGDREAAIHKRKSKKDDSLSRSCHPNLESSYWEALKQPPTETQTRRKVRGRRSTSVAPKSKLHKYTREKAEFDGNQSIVSSDSSLFDATGWSSSEASPMVRGRRRSIGSFTPSRAPNKRLEKYVQSSDSDCESQSESTLNQPQGMLHTYYARFNDAKKPTPVNQESLSTKRNILTRQGKKNTLSDEKVNSLSTGWTDDERSVSSRRSSRRNSIATSTPRLGQGGIFNQSISSEFSFNMETGWTDDDASSVAMSQISSEDSIALSPPYGMNTKNRLAIAARLGRKRQGHSRRGTIL